MDVQLRGFEGGDKPSCSISGGVFKVFPVAGEVMVGSSPNVQIAHKVPVRKGYRAPSTKILSFIPLALIRSEAAEIGGD